MPRSGRRVNKAQAERPPRTYETLDHSPEAVHLRARAWAARKSVQAYFADAREGLPVGHLATGALMVERGFRAERSRYSQPEPSNSVFDAELTVSRIMSGDHNDAEHVSMLLDILGTSPEDAAKIRTWLQISSKARLDVPPPVRDALELEMVESLPRQGIVGVFTQPSDMLSSPEMIRSRARTNRLSDVHGQDLVEIAQRRFENWCNTEGPRTIVVREDLLARIRGPVSNLQHVKDRLDQLRSAGVVVQLLPANQRTAIDPRAYGPSHLDFLSGEDIHIVTNSIPGRASVRLNFHNLANLQTEIRRGDQPRVAISNTQEQAVDPNQSARLLQAMFNRSVSRFDLGAQLIQQAGREASDQDIATVYEHLAIKASQGGYTSQVFPWRWGLPGDPPTDFESRYGRNDKQVYADAIEARFAAGAPTDPHAAARLQHLIRNVPEYRSPFYQHPGANALAGSVETVAESVPDPAAGMTLAQRASAHAADRRVRAEIRAFSDAHDIRPDDRVGLNVLVRDFGVGPGLAARWVNLEVAGRDMRASWAEGRSGQLAVEFHNAITVHIHAETSIPSLLLPPDMVRARLEKDNAHRFGADKLDAEAINRAAAAYEQVRQDLAHGRTKFSAVVELPLLAAMEPDEVNRVREFWAQLGAEGLPVVVAPEPTDRLALFERDQISVTGHDGEQRIFATTYGGLRPPPSSNTNVLTVGPQLKELAATAATPSQTDALLAIAAQPIDPRRPTPDRASLLSEAASRIQTQGPDRSGPDNIDPDADPGLGDTRPPGPDTTLPVDGGGAAVPEHHTQNQDRSDTDNTAADRKSMGLEEARALVAAARERLAPMPVATSTKPHSDASAMLPDRFDARPNNFDFDFEPNPLECIRLHPLTLTANRPGADRSGGGMDRG